MKKIIFAIIAVLAAFNAYADRMYIDNFSIEAGETKKVSINLDNSSALSAFQLELYLPNGLTMALDSRGRLRCGVNTDRADDHTLTFKDRGNGQYNAVYYSNNSYEIYDNSGEIVYFYVTAAENFSGTATIELREVYVSDPQGKDTKLANSSCTVTGPTPVNPPVGNCSMGIDDFSINAGETVKVGINLNNDIPLTAFQLEMFLPQGLSMALDSRGRLRCGVNTDRADDHTLTFKDRGNGQYNAVYYSNNSYEIYGNSGEIVYFYVTAAENFSGTATIELREVYVSDPQGKDTKLANSSCIVTGAIPNIKATSVSLDKSTVTLTKGENTTLTATVLPENATDKSVTWTSSNTAVATVAGGIVTAVAPGNATITVKTADGTNLTATCAVTVNAPIVKATSVSLDKSNVTLTTGENTTLTATVLPDNTTDKSVTWTSSNTAVATVAGGIVTAVAPGNATITVKTADGTNLTATCAVAIADNIVANDGQVYEPVNDIKIKNLWIMDRVHTPAEFNDSPLSQGTYARMATLKDNVVYVSRSGAQLAVTENGDEILQCVVYRFDALTGKRLADLPLTLGGKPYGTKYASDMFANSIGTDNFGHLWIAPYTNETSSVQKIYKLDDETGELTLVAELDKDDALARIDYIDLVGDITREEAMCTIMSMGSQVATVYRWQAKQGADFKGGFDGDTYMDFYEFYPETVSSWGYAPYVKICLGEDDENMYAGELFWLDGFQTAPALYDFTGEMITSFEPVAVDSPELVPEAGTNGVTEFSLEGRNFIAYSMAQYVGNGHGCQANICELGPNKMLNGVKHYWTIPADSLGKVSDSGTRIHCLNAQKGVNAEGNEEITLLTYKCYNGIGVYRISKKDNPKPDYPNGDVDGNGVVDITDTNILINIILGKDDAANYDGRADVDGNGVVDITDANIVINIILGK